MTVLAPYFFMQLTANSSYIIPSLMFLFSKDLMMNMFWSLTGSRSWMLISPSLNLELMVLPRVISRCEVTYLARISASKAKILKLNDWRGSEVRKILLMEILISSISTSVYVSGSLSALIRLRPFRNTRGKVRTKHPNSFLNITFINS